MTQIGFAHVQIDPPLVLKQYRQHPRADGLPPVGLIPGTAVVPVVQEDPPEYDSRTQRLQRTETITADQLMRGWNVVSRSSDEVVQAIKERAQEVIYDRVPAWKQANMMADSIAAMAQGTRPAREAEYQSAWGWIQQVRTVSGQLEVAALAGDPVDLTLLEVP